MQFATVNLFVFCVFLTGFVTSIRHHEQKMLLCVESTYNVVRNETALETLNKSKDTDVIRRRVYQKKDFKDTIVMTVYNRKTYHVDDVAFDESPKTKIQCKNDTVTLAEYYKSKYDTEIKDLDQPLLIVKPSPGDPYIIYLIPELCQPIGMTNRMTITSRGQPTALVKDVAKYLHQRPQEKAKVLNNFMKRMLENETVCSLPFFTLSYIY